MEIVEQNKILNTKLIKIICSIFAFAFVVWLGGTVFRTSLAYNLFTVGIDMHLKPLYSNLERMNTIYLFSTTALLTDIAYCICVIAAVALAFNMKGHLKKRGWLVISFVLFALTLPIQAYFINMDWHLTNTVYYRGITDFYHPDVQKYFVKRFMDVSNASMRSIVLLFAFTIILYLIWQPLDKTKIQNNEIEKLGEKNDE